MNAQMPPALMIGAATLLGACIGSFLNVVIHRLPRGASLVWPGSHCPGCDAAIPWWANVPIVSYVALGGKCRSCGVSISSRYPLVEAATAVLFAALMIRALGSATGVGPRLLVDWLLAATLIAVTFIDAEHQIIPNAITYPGIPLGLLLAWAAPPPGLTEAVLGLTIAGGSMWALSAADGSLRRLDAVSGDVLVTVPVGRDPIDAVFSGSSVWVALRSGETLIEVDTRTSAIVSRTTLPATPIELIPGETGVFVALDGEVPLVLPSSQ